MNFELAFQLLALYCIWTPKNVRLLCMTSRDTLNALNATNLKIELIRSKENKLDEVLQLKNFLPFAHFVVKNFVFNSKDTEILTKMIGKKLSHLNLSGCEIGPEGVQRLVSVLGQCGALVHLDLSYNNMGSEGATNLAGVLGKFTVLAHLDLSYNYLQPEGAESLAGVLGQCTALTHLDLSYSNFGPSAESVYAIQKALQKYQMTNNIWFRYLPPYIPGSTFDQMESLIEYRNYFNMDLDRLREEDKDPVFFSDD